MHHCPATNYREYTAMLLPPRFALFSILTLFLWAPFATAQEHPVVRICHGSSAPYVVENKDGSQSGIWPSILTEAFALAGLDYQLERMPRERCLLDSTSEDPTYEITAGRIYTRARAAKYWTVPVMQHYGVIFYSKTRFPDGIPSANNGAPSAMLNDLRDTPLCGFNGWHYEYYMETAGFADDWEPIIVDDNDTQNRFSAALKMVDAARCDAVEIPASAFLSVMDEPEFLSRFGCFPLTLERSDITYLMVSKTSPRSEALAVAMFQSLATMQEYRRVRAILEEFFVVRNDLPTDIKNCIVNGARAISN